MKQKNFYTTSEVLNDVGGVFKDQAAKVKRMVAKRYPDELVKKTNGGKIHHLSKNVAADVATELLERRIKREDKKHEERLRVLRQKIVDWQAIKENT